MAPGNTITFYQVGPVVVNKKLPFCNRATGASSVSVALIASNRKVSREKIGMLFLVDSVKTYIPRHEAIPENAILNILADLSARRGCVLHCD